MLDYQTERKIQYLLQHLQIPEESHLTNNPNQPRDHLGRFTETETEFQFDYDRVTFVPLTAKLYVRQTKKKYLMIDALILLSLSIVGIIVFASF